MTKDLRWLLAELKRIGTAATPEAIANTFALCAEIQRPSDRVTGRIDQDLVYGPDARHRLDVYAPTKTSQRKVPVMLYVHGGGFTGGDKRLPDLPFYEHVGRWAVDRGFVAVLMNYRLAPDHAWPAGAEDVGAVVAWIRAHIWRHGGDPRRIVVVGHSAGAAHTAFFIAGDGGPGAEHLAGAVVLSGIYDTASAVSNTTSAEQEESLRVYFGEAKELIAGRTTLPQLADRSLPLLFGAAEFDWPVFRQQARLLLRAKLDASEELPRFVLVPGHTHFSQVLTLGFDGGALGESLQRFIEHCGGP